jgi:hypothetical protein
VPVALPNVCFVKTGHDAGIAKLPRMTLERNGDDVRRSNALARWRIRNSIKICPRAFRFGDIDLACASTSSAGWAFFSRRCDANGNFGLDSAAWDMQTISEFNLET